MFCKKNIKWFVTIIVAIMLCLGIFVCVKLIREKEIIKTDLERLSTEFYNSVFLSMCPISNYSEKDFLDFRGEQTIIADHQLRDASELDSYLTQIVSSGNHPSTVFLYIDPYVLWQNCGKREEKWNESLYQGLYSYVESYPDILYEIMLPYPFIDYWLDKDEKEIDDILAPYENLICQGSAYSNLRLYFVGHEYWLIRNPDNYSSQPFDLNRTIAQKIFLFCFCDHTYEITKDNQESILGSLKNLIRQEKREPVYYPDLSNLCIIFFGDSTIAYVSGSYSIPGYIAGLSDASTYSFAVGGTRASTDSKDDLGFPNVVDQFIEKSNSDTKEECISAIENDIEQGKQLYFICNFGLNDYFSGSVLDNPEDLFDTATYKGALRYSIARLRESYPEAGLCIMSPTYTSYYNNGTEVNSSVGGQLIDYVRSAKEVAEEMDVLYMNNYNELGVDATNVNEYTTDGCHPNEKGRLNLAVHIMYFLEEIEKRAK